MLERLVEIFTKPVLRTRYFMVHSLVAQRVGDMLHGHPRLFVRPLIIPNVIKYIVLICSLEPQRTLKDSTLSHVLPKPTAAAPKPLFDKTPFPNRISTSPLSSTRKHIRVPRSASRSFETPPNKGNHWEANYIGISLQEAQAQAIVEVEEGKEDYEEIEYMPPRPIGKGFIPHRSDYVS